MKVLIINNNHPSYLRFGGELTTEQWVLQGLREGLDIDWLDNKGNLYEYGVDGSYEIREGVETLPEADIYILGNFEGFDDTLLKKIKKTGNYAIIHHNSNDIGGHYLFNRVPLSITLAPTHLAQLKSVKCEKNFVTTCYVDSEVYVDRGVRPLERLQKSVYVGTLSKIKIDSLMINEMKAHKSAEYVFYGKPHDEVVSTLKGLDNVKVFGEVGEEEIVDILNRYKVFFWKMNRYGGFGRTIVEARLCGCLLNMNKERFGIFDYDDIDWGSRQSLVEKLETDLSSFWSKVLKHFGYV